MVAQVLAAEPGSLHYVDANSDGKPEEVWYLDTSPRNPPEAQPVLVKVIDKDGDLVQGGLPDLDNDVYVYDWNANGVADAVIEYSDTNADQGVDEMAMYSAGDRYGAPPGSLFVWWSKDVGGDHRLWYDVAGAYIRELCQWRCHFAGDEMFSAFYLTADAQQWKPAFEDPFVFYDPKHDMAGKQAIRYEITDGILKTFRQSFDADTDSTREHPHDYDVSITAYPPDGFKLDPQNMQPLTLRGIPTEPILTHAAAEHAADQVAWNKVLFTWDENDDNVDGEKYADRNERWEGVVAAGTEGFPQVGTPSCGPVNKRYELGASTGKPLQVYFDPVDHRIHLANATKAWMDVDADGDHNPDMKYQFADTNNDGIIDTWTVDVNADGTPDDTWKAADANVTHLGWNWAEVSAAWTAALAADLPAVYALEQRLEQALAKAGTDPATDPDVQLLRTAFTAPSFDADRRVKTVSSSEALLFYFGIVRDRLIVQLKKVHAVAPFWQGFEDARGHGDYAKMRALVEQEFALTDALPEYAAWLAAEKTKLPNPPRVAWAQDYSPNSIGWESEKVAYRSYWGQIDFYGKKGKQLILPTLKTDGPDRETDWGMDSLYVRDTAGCGGITLYINGTAYPVRSPGGVGTITFEKGLVEQTADKVTIEVRAAHVGPDAAPYTVRLRFTAFADRADSAVEVLVDGGTPQDQIELGIGITHLSQQDLLVDSGIGVMGVKGIQSQFVGPISLGVVFPAARFKRFGNAPSENQVVISVEKATPLVYHIIADWQRGEQYPIAPSSAQWLEDLRALAQQLALK